MCGTGMRAMMFAHDMLAAGSADVVVAGGMESMTNAPHLMFARKGVKYGAAQLFDHMALDGLEDAYERGKAMGVFAEQCVDKYRLQPRGAGPVRDRLDAARARRPTKTAASTGRWRRSRVPGKGGETVVKFDEQPFKAKLDKIPSLKPAFKKDGTITAANASSISDGAAALVLMRESARVEARLQAAGAHRRPRGLRAGARMVRHRAGRRDPARRWPRPAGRPDEVELWEVNEAFAAVTMAAMSEFKLPHDIVNVHGGACALGHPIGASGARIVVTLLGALRKRGAKRGVAALCIGGGEATAMAVEML